MKKSMWLSLLLLPAFLAGPAAASEHLSAEANGPKLEHSGNQASDLNTWASSYNRRTGVTITRYRNRDGGYTLVKRNRYGRIIAYKRVRGSYRHRPWARSYDRYSGITTTMYRNRFGGYTIVKRNRYGRVISVRRVRG